ncbi:MAG: calcium/sodium antiporter [Deltaproteobacteria bacterium]
MNPYLSVALIVAGLCLLVAGAEALVRGAASLAKKLGVPQLAIGLTIVAFGTSSPELAVNLFSAFRGNPDIAIGNIIGSNIANILLILGISSAISPLQIKGSTVFKEIPFALLAVCLVFTMGNDALFDGSTFSAITRTEGFTLIGLFAVFIYYVFGLAKNKEVSPEEVRAYSYPVSLVLTILGLALLVAGGKVLVDNAVMLARLTGLSESFIGLTVIAVGTSLPEMATSVVASMHRHHDIAVGNIVGSNIFNVFFILGVTGTIINLPFNRLVNPDVIVSILATALLFALPIAGRRRTIERWHGVLFIALYAVYVLYLVQRG